MSKTIRIGTRGSQLALWQANEVSNRLRALGYRPEIVVIKTTGYEPVLLNGAFSIVQGETSQLEIHKLGTRAAPGRNINGHWPGITSIPFSLQNSTAFMLTAPLPTARYIHTCLMPAT